MTSPKPPLKDAEAIEVPASILEMGEEWADHYVERICILTEGLEPTPYDEEMAIMEVREEFERKIK
jgi:hypothetical protein